MSEDGGGGCFGGIDEDREVIIHKNKFILGLDIHGVVDQDPQRFLDMAEQVKANGGEVHILTGGPLGNGKIEESLLKYTNGVVWWDVLFSVYDYLIDSGQRTNAQLGIASRYPFPDKVWNKVKSIYCVEHKVSQHWDDMPEYLEHFTTPYVLVDWYGYSGRGRYGRSNESSSTERKESTETQ